MKTSAWKDGLGAFADGAILFPLIAALSLQGSLPVDRLLVTAGLAYVFTGLIFRIPMPVQPLKSIAIAAVAVHASGAEIRASGAILGAICVVLAFLTQRAAVMNYVRAIPPFFVRALQTALGVILAVQGIKFLLPLPALEKVASLVVLTLVFALPAFPLLGFFATAGLIAGVFLNWKSGGAPASLGGALSGSTPTELLRPTMLISLVLPQIALTFANSVVSTREVAHQYFGRAADRVTEPRLLQSIGFGNLISAAIGGLPYCHGAGGLTAHYRGGARTFRANLIIGFTLVILAGVTHLGGRFALLYPLFLLGSLLIAIGWFHFGLVRAQKTAGENWKLLLVALVAAYTQTMSWPLVAAIVLSLPVFQLRKSMSERPLPA